MVCHLATHAGRTGWLLVEAAEHRRRVEALLPYSESALVQDCYDYGRVLKMDYREEGIYLEAELVDEMRAKLARYLIQE